jgi:hypothetical protein
MEGPFRESAGALAVVESNAALDVLEADEPAPLETQIVSLGADPPKIEDGDPMTTPALRAEAEALEFKRLGKVSFSRTVFERRVVDFWVDPLEIVRVTMSVQLTVQQPNDRGVAMATMFDDGSLLITVADNGGPKIANARIVRRVAKNDLSRDYEAHLEAITAHAKRGCQPIRVRDLATAIRMRQWEESRLGRKVARLRLLLMMVGAVLIYLVLHFQR